LSMGIIVALTDLRAVRRTAEARRALEDSLAEVGAMAGGTAGGMAGSSTAGDSVVGAILTNASLAAMDIADAASGPTVAPLLDELEASARRATALYAQLRDQTR